MNFSTDLLKDWYDVNATDFIEYLEDYHNTFSRPLWITEWACQNFNDANAQCSYDDVILFLNTTQGFMDQTEWVERYSWFGAMRDMQGVNEDNALMTDGGDINALGRQYIGAEEADPSATQDGSAEGPRTTAGAPQWSDSALIVRANSGVGVLVLILTAMVMLLAI